MSRSNASLKPSSGDPIITWLIVGVLAVTVLILTAAMWAVATSVMDPPAPRSYYERQIELLKTVVEQKPKSAAAWADYARAYIAAERYTQADSVLTRGEKILGTKRPELTLERARVAVARGDYAEGLKLAENCIKVTNELRDKTMKEMISKGLTIDVRTIHGTELAAAAELKGDLLAQKKQWKDAVEAYDMAIFENPESADDLVKRGAVYIEMKQEKKARADFEKALTFIPQFEPALSGLKRLEKGEAR